MIINSDNKKYAKNKTINLDGVDYLLQMIQMFDLI